MVGSCRVDEASRLTTIDDLSELSVEEGVLDVQLASLPLDGEREGEDDVDRRRFNNRAERLIEVNALLLGETAKHPTCFVVVKGAIGLELVAKDPVAGDDVGLLRRGTRSQVSLPRRARYSAGIASSQLGSLRVARSEEGTGGYLLTEACKLSRSWGGMRMPEVLHV